MLEEGANEFVGELLSGMEDDAAGCRAMAASLTGSYFKTAQSGLSEHVPVIVGARGAARVRLRWTAVPATPPLAQLRIQWQVLAR